MRIELRPVIVWAILIAGMPVAARPSGPEAGALATRINSLSLEVTEPGAVVTLLASPPPGRFSCILRSAPDREAVLEIPGAESRLQPAYQFSSALVPEAHIEEMQGGGVRIRLALREAALQGVERTETGLRLRFARGLLGSPDPVDPSEYHVGIGDKLEITVFGHEDMSKVVEIRGDGTLNYPLIGDLKVAGKTVAEIAAGITDLLSKDYLVDPQVSVEVKEYQSQWVTMIGEVRTPGRYVLRRNMRLIDLLAEAGGASKEAGSQIVITRKSDGGQEAKQIIVDRERLFGPGNESANLLLSHGDIVSLGEKETFYIRGEVTRPGSYFLESGMTIMKAISVAGGFSQFANQREVEVIRASDKEPHRKIVVNLKAIERGKKADVPLVANDTVIVPRRIF